MFLDIWSRFVDFVGCCFCQRSSSTRITIFHPVCWCKNIGQLLASSHDFWKMFRKTTSNKESTSFTLRMHLQVSIYAVYTDRFGVSESFRVFRLASASNCRSFTFNFDSAKPCSHHDTQCFYMFFMTIRIQSVLSSRKGSCGQTLCKNLADFAGNLSDVNKSINSTFSWLSCKKEKPGQNKLRFGISMKSIHPACAVRESRLALVTIGQIS